MPKKICVVTSSRADYGLLFWLMKEVAAQSNLTLQIVASGMHLSPEFGLTYQSLLRDGFIIDEKVEMLLSSDTAVGIAKSIGLGVIGFADAFNRLNPDCIVLLGDRFETFAAAQAAFIAKIPIAHLHGGELTMGAYDDGIRHSITKMSQLHFVAAKPYQHRVIQLGENPDNVYCVGAMVLDAISRLTLLEKNQLESLLGIRFNELNFVITYHPETLGSTPSKQGFLALLDAISTFENTNFIFTKGNADSDGRIINELIDQFCAENSSRAKAFDALGQQKCLSLLKNVDVIVGNSSSGILEAPFFKTPTVNIGDRQQGRIRAASIIDCANDAQDIIRAIKTALSSEFKQKLMQLNLPYGEGNVAKKVVEVLEQRDLRSLIKKQFYDIK
ncbi:MAG: UDP-N-acetylglucosamine 2-epimerase [Candidatus Berkiellales bacterium]